MRQFLLLATLLSGPSAFEQSIPFAYWPLDETAGTIVHDHVGENDGSLQGNAVWQPLTGHHGGALRFNGNDARADLGPCDITTGPGDQLSLACWFKPDIVSGTERILMAKTLGPDASDFVWSLSLVNSTGARFRVRTGGDLHTIEIPPGNIYSNTWYHLAATYDGAALRLFLNGSSAANGTATGSIGFHPQAPVTLGNLYDNSKPFFGSLDDVRIYDHEINGVEVVDLVIGEITLGVDAPPIGLTAEGMLRLPPGPHDLVRILDASGRTVLVQRGNTGPPPSFAGLPAGLYLVCLQGPDGASTHRLVKP